MREARSASQPEWDAWLQGSPGGGHILQSHEWGEFKRRHGWRPVRLVIERDDVPAGVGQFLIYHTPTTGNLMYCPRGPWIDWDDEQAVRTFFGGVRTVAEREGVHTVKIEPEVLEANERIRSLLADIGFRRSRYTPQFKTTMVVDLARSEDELLAAMKSKTRYNIRLAARKGVTVEEDNSLRAREMFYRMHEETAERDGFRLRGRDYYFDCWQAMYDAERAHLFLAKHEGDALAGMLIFTLGDKYWYQYGASSSEKRNLMPMYLLQWEVMRWAKARGFAYYDMVAIPNPDNLNESDPMWGLYRFKSGFGGEVREFTGALDLTIRRARAWAWYNFEPWYYRFYRRVLNQNYY